MLEKELTYTYDGSFAGFLCCVFESYTKKQLPFDIQSIQKEQSTLFENIFIPTDKIKAQRVQKSIQDKLGLEVYQFLRQAFLTNLHQKELYMLDFIRLAYEKGAKVLLLLTTPTVHKLNKAIKHLHNEAMHYKGFLRFSVYKETMVAVVEPKNFILPFLAGHFKARFPNETFFIYDKTNKAALIYQNGEFSIDLVEEFDLPPLEKKEEYYRTLWRAFHKAIAIKKRENTSCQNTNLPKRYRHLMTEFQ